MLKPVLYPLLIITVVLPLVHGVPSVLSTHVIFGCIPADWHNGACPVGFNAIYVAPTGL